MNCGLLWSWCAAIALGTMALTRAADPSARVPIEIPATSRVALEERLGKLDHVIEALTLAAKTNRTIAELLPDVLIFQKAVRWPMQYAEFTRTNDAGIAQQLLQQGLERAAQLQNNNAPWTTATGLVVRGYVSKIDGSVQPYGLVVPPSYRALGTSNHRLDVWLHGRDNNLTELKFLTDRQRSAGEFAPPDTLVLHPYGRYCNAFKFAGEIDVFEALEHVRNHYRVDSHRMLIRGFSMGGAGCWHLAAHHAGFWAAANPGAGFVDVPIYTRLLDRQPRIPAYEQQLWHLYDALDYAPNLYNCPVVAYSGEIDKQKQAGDLMAAAMLKSGVSLRHVIGPNTEHRYHPEAKREVAERIDQIAQAGKSMVPGRVLFTTYTLRYNQMHWITVDGLEQHWQRSQIDARLLDGPESNIRVQTEHITAFTIAMPPGSCPFDATAKPVVEIDGAAIATSSPLSDRSWTVRFRKQNGRWTSIREDSNGGLQKVHGLQGPIDDAFMDRFVMVTPSGTPWNLESSILSEQKNAIKEWRSQFRGDARVASDEQLSESDIAHSNLILWGDPNSNKTLAKIIDRLPLRWTASEITLGGKKYDAAKHLPVMIYPNPLNPRRYVVLNSGFTFPAFRDQSNALQTPKLPDYAILKIDGPGKPAVAEAGFFSEQWEPLSP